MDKNYKLPKLCKYRELDISVQITSHQILISYMHKKYLYNIFLTNTG